jgi:two-component system chemotaxis response regulator CheY
MALIEFNTIAALVVDDQEFVRKMIVQFLNKLGCVETFQAADGDAAYAACIRYNPDLVICDLNMKPTNGFDFMRKLRNSPNAPDKNVPVIFLSSNTESGAAAKAFALEADAYLTKPVSPNLLKERIQRLLPAGAGSAGKVNRHPSQPLTSKSGFDTKAVEEKLRYLGFSEIRGIHREGEYWHVDAKSPAKVPLHLVLSPYTGEIIRVR